MAANKASEGIRLSDYRKPEFTTDHVDLNFDIHDDATYATSVVTYTRTDEGKDANALVLSAQNPNVSEGTQGNEPYILDVMVDGVTLSEGSDYVFDNKAQTLTIPLAPGQKTAQVEIRTRLIPESNTELSGFYKTGPVYCTQCESEGFRRITPFLDRPDVMATYDVRIESDPKIGDVMLSNGNPVVTGTTPSGRKYAQWSDPHPKPSYLFATVSGDLEYIEDYYTTASGRDVTLRIYTEQGQKERARFSMECLIKSMKWDEDVYGREYDLDLFNIVAVDNFTFGAMENKSLNVFAAKYIFADPETETDADFHGVDRVVAHEYFHNWTGNRVTLENWFHIALKEGFTVFRDQEYSADHGNRDLQRIRQVQSLRARQFPADDSPLAFPVLPKEVESITNIYGATTYDKAAELLRMIRTMIGADEFRKASDLYFDRYDGQAVRIENLVQCFEDITGYDFASGQFMNWYHQSGRPRVKATRSYDPAAKELTLTLEQSTPPSADQPKKDPFVIPVKMGLIDPKTGKEVPIELSGDTQKDKGATERTILFDQDKQTFTFKNVPEGAIPSLMREFSAPVDLEDDLGIDELTILMKSDTDGFKRWDAGQKVLKNELLRQYESIDQTGRPAPVSKKIADALKGYLDASVDAGFAAAALSLPSIGDFEGAVDGPVKPDVIGQSVKALNEYITKSLKAELIGAYNRLDQATTAYHYSPAEAGERSLKNTALARLASQKYIDAYIDAQRQYNDADNMTDRMGALSALNKYEGFFRDKAFKAFKDDYKDDIPTMQKWLSLQASRSHESTIDTVRDIMDNEPAFRREIAHNWYALIGAFAANYGEFHREDGSGYDLVAEGVLKADKVNSAIAANLSEKLCDWKKYDGPHRHEMYRAVRVIALTPGISSNLKANVMKALEPEDIAFIEKLNKGPKGKTPRP